MKFRGRGVGQRPNRSFDLHMFVFVRKAKKKHDFLLFRTEQIYCNRESGEIARESEWEALVMDAIAMDIAMMMINMGILGLFMFLVFFHMVNKWSS